MSKNPPAWEILSDRLPKDVLSLLQPKPSLLVRPKQTKEEYEEFYSLLPPDVQDVLPAPICGEEDEVDTTTAAYYLIVSDPDSGVVVQRFRNCAAMATQMGSREGDDVYMVPIFGVLLPYTTGPRRLLFTGDDNTALTIPVFVGDTPAIVTNVHAESYDLQYDFYVGPQYMLDGVQLESPYDEDGDEENPNGELPAPDAPDDPQGDGQSTPA